MEKTALSYQRASKRNNGSEYTWTGKGSYGSACQWTGKSLIVPQLQLCRWSRVLSRRTSLPLGEANTCQPLRPSEVCVCASMLRASQVCIFCVPDSSVGSPVGGVRNKSTTSRAFSRLDGNRQRSSQLLGLASDGTRERLGGCDVCVFFHEGSRTVCLPLFGQRLGATSLTRRDNTS